MIDRSTDITAALRSRQRGFLLNPFRFGAPAFTGALDPYTSGLWSAFGISRMLSSYIGPLIRVRRSSDNTEQDIGYTPSGALDESSLLSFVGSSSAYVVKTYDQSGGGNNFSQTTQSSQPRIVNAGAYDGSMIFDGSDDRLLSEIQTPAVEGLTFSGRYCLREAAATGTTQSIFTHGNAGASGHNTMIYQQQGNQASYNAYLFEGASNYRAKDFLYVTTGEVCDVLVGNKELSGASKIALWRSGGELSAHLAPGPGVSTSPFTLETVAIASYPDGAQPAKMNGKWFAIWQIAQNANGAAISAAI